MKHNVLRAALLLVFPFIVSCRTDDELIIPSQEEQVDTMQIALEDTAAIKGFYLLNEGNMGSNKCHLTGKSSRVHLGIKHTEKEGLINTGI